MQGAVGHEVIVADGGVVEDGELELVAVGDGGRELLVVGGLVGLLLGAGLPDSHLVHADGHVGVQQLVALAEQRVAEGPAGGLQAHRLPDAHLQVPVELHGSGHGREEKGTPGRSTGPPCRAQPSRARSQPPPLLLRGPGGGGAASPGPCRGPGTAAPAPRPSFPARPGASRSEEREGKGKGKRLGTARLRGHLDRGTEPGGEEPPAPGGRARARAGSGGAGGTGPGVGG